MHRFFHHKRSLGAWCLLALTAPTMHAVSQEPSKSQKIDHEIIKILDGKSWGLHGEVIGVMYQVIVRIRHMLYGVFDKTTKTRTGTYKFDGEMHSIISLAQLESQLNADFFSHEQQLVNTTLPEDIVLLKSLKKDHLAKKSSLYLIHATIKDDFKNTTKSYVEAARGFKEQMLILIKESCKLRGKDKCFLLKWGEAAEGKEMEHFDRDITTFDAMADFFEDLVAFLEDLINSCEKGREQFKQIMNKAQQKRNKTV